MSETKTTPEDTVLHFFTNNRGYFSGFPGGWHVRYTGETDYEVGKTVVAASNIPHAQMGEQDLRGYGVELTGNPWLATFPDVDAKTAEHPEGFPTPAIVFLTEMNKRSNAQVVATRALADQVAKLTASVESLRK